MKNVAFRFGIFICLLVSCLLFSQKAVAYTTIIHRQQPLVQGMYFPNEVKLSDPTKEGKMIYGSLETPYAVESYYFIPSKNETLSIELITPVRPSNETFRP